MTHRRLTVAAMIALLALAPGCSRGTAPVAGRVTYQGKPVVWGSVTLKAADGSIHQIGINLDGTYRLEGVPIGLAMVGVSSPDPAPSARARQLGGDEGRGRPGPPPVPPGAWFPLPDKYVEPAMSGLTIQVGSGNGDLELK
jgi:hypothetical protein